MADFFCGGAWFPTFTSGEVLDEDHFGSAIPQGGQDIASLIVWQWFSKKFRLRVSGEIEYIPNNTDPDDPTYRRAAFGATFSAVSAENTISGRNSLETVEDLIDAVSTGDYLISEGGTSPLTIPFSSPVSADLYRSGFIPADEEQGLVDNFRVSLKYGVGWNIAPWAGTEEFPAIPVPIFRKATGGRLVLLYAYMEILYDITRNFVPPHPEPGAVTHTEFGWIVQTGTTPFTVGAGSVGAFAVGLAEPASVSPSSFFGTPLYADDLEVPSMSIQLEVHETLTPPDLP